jgi:large subunit ribosomal protein L22
MEVKASLKHLRMSSQKVRLVLDVIRKMPVEAALEQLKFINKISARPIATLVKSAVANGVSLYNLKEDNLYIKEIHADAGKTLKRWMPRAQGRATAIRKRACHISLVLAEIKESGKKEKKVVKTADPIKLEKLAKEGEKKVIKKGTKDKKENDPKLAGEKTKIFRRKSG